tara:strand:+ start:663 stop:920 length:258 start_codon:yes stop_codon:yes gene_type:complete
MKKLKKNNEMKRLTPKTIDNIEYVTWKMIVDHHGKEWADEWKCAAGDGNTMVSVEEDGETVGGIFIWDYERFADAVDRGEATYWD